jgi:hypothetical protein
LIAEAIVSGFFFLSLGFCKKLFGGGIAIEVPWGSEGGKGRKIANGSRCVDDGGQGQSDGGVEKEGSAA